MNRLVVDASVEWIDRKEINPGDNIVCKSVNDQPCVCIYINPTDCTPGRWEIWGSTGGNRLVTASKFIDFFNKENSSGQPLKGWKFYKVE